MKTLGETATLSKRTKRATLFKGRRKHQPHEQTTGSEASMEPGEIIEVQQQLSIPKEELLQAVRTLYDLVFRRRYNDDVLLCSLSLFKKYMRLARCSTAEAVVLAACFRLATQLLQSRRPTSSDMVSLCLYQFTREQLIEAEDRVLLLTNCDIGCHFKDDLRQQLKQELSELSIRIVEEHPHFLIFSNF